MFRGSGRSGEIPVYEQWLGSSVSHVLDFWGAMPLAAPDPWQKIKNPTWILQRWRPHPWQLVLSVVMLPNRNLTLAAGAAGKYDTHWRSFFRTVNAICPTAVIRLGWEFNIKAFPWAAGGQEDLFVVYWRRIATIAREEAPDVRLGWCPLAGNTNADVEACWPGAAFVDVVGLDAYDTARPGLTGDARWRHQRTRPWGLDWHKAFAGRHDKPRSFDEWGLTVRPKDALGGGDNPLYITRMLVELAQVEFANYFEVDARDAAHRLMLGRFPKSAARYRVG